MLLHSMRYDCKEKGGKSSCITSLKLDLELCKYHCFLILFSNHVIKHPTVQGGMKVDAALDGRNSVHTGEKEVIVAIFANSTTSQAQREHPLARSIMWL